MHSASAVALVTDGDPLVVIGDAAATERFLTAGDLPSTELWLPRLSEVGGGLHVIASGGTVHTILGAAGESPARPLKD